MRQVFPASRSGFTMLDALAAIAVVGVLVVVALPGFKRVNMKGNLVAEQALAADLVRGMTAYTRENQDRIMPSAAHWAWIHAPENAYSMFPQDCFDRSRRVEGSAVKVWTLQYLGWANAMDPTAIQVDVTTQNAFNARSPLGIILTPGLVSYVDSSRPTAYGFHPTLGMNGVYVGGAYPFGAFRGQVPGGAWGDPAPAPNPQVSGGNFYVQSIDKVRRPDLLLLFASSRGGDVSGTAYWNYGASNPDTGAIRPGYWLVRPPAAHPAFRGSYNQPYSLITGWASSTNDTFDALRAPSYWGNLDMRYSAQSVTAMIDGHVAMQSLTDLRDMRKWANMGKTPGWRFPTNPNQIYW